MKETLSKRETAALQILAAFIASGQYTIPHHGNTETIVRRELVDKEKDEWEMISSAEDQSRCINHYIDLSYRIADKFLEE